MTQQPVMQNPNGGMWTPPQQMTSRKSFLATWLLAWLLGGLGIDRFYLGKIGTGILKLITLGGFGIWYLIDLVMTLAGAQKDKAGLPLQGYNEHRKIAWIITIAFVVLGMLIGAFSPKADPTSMAEAPVAAEAPKVAEEAPAKADTATEEPSEAPSEKAPKQEAPAEVAPEEPVDEQTEEKTEEEAPAAAVEEEPDVPAEFQSALTKAESYSDTMHMSKAGIYDQLTSEYGEDFSTDAAQYAIDNMSADWNQNALEKARSYQDDMAMSPNAIHDQLTSEYGEQFTQSQADYAIKHLND